MIVPRAERSCSTCGGMFIRSVRATDRKVTRFFCSRACPDSYGPSRTHGHSATTEYRIWSQMRGRCANPRGARWSSYGGRGITVCARWHESFENFLADMGPRPAGTTLDRKDNDGNYEPGNCRWATRIEQQNNMRSNRIVVVSGERMTLAEACRRAGLDSSLVGGRLHRGESIAKALRPAPHRRQTTIDEMAQIKALVEGGATQSEAARLLGLHQTVVNRICIKKGWRHV